MLTAGERSSDRAFAHGVVASIATALAMHGRDDSEAAVTTSDVFRQIAERHAEFSPSGTLSLRWQAEPLTIHQLLGESLSDESAQDIAPMVGRDDSNTRGRVALIRGEPGMGKSRLAREFGRVAGKAGHAYLLLRFVPEMQHFALGPLLQVVGAGLGFAGGHTPKVYARSPANADMRICTPA